MKTKRGKIAFLVLLFSCIILVCFVGVICTKSGRRWTSKVAADYLHGNLNYVPVGNGQSNKEPTLAPVSGGSLNVETEEGKQTGTEEIESEAEDIISSRDGVINILLLGEEAIRSTPGFGRTDVMMIASIHPKDKVIRLTSLLRDTYIEVPGYSPRKLNSVYATGGVELLYEVIQNNYKIKLDGYMLVGFDAFEEVIDILGGVEVTLTEEEAQYLRTHNYISKEEYRNVRAGTQLMNGNQALGYCRVRFVPNINGTANDYGRTERQRMVLSAVFESYKSAGMTKWIQILQDALGLITTDIDQTLLEEMIFTVYDNRITKIENFRVPVEGAYTSPKEVGNVTYPLVLDWEANVKALREFIYGGNE